MFGLKSSNIGLQRLLAMKKARIWRAFLIRRRKISEARNAWLGREDSNRDMANWIRMLSPVREESQNLFFVEVHRPFETLEFREPYRIRGVQSCGER